MQQFHAPRVPLGQNERPSADSLCGKGVYEVSRPFSKLSSCEVRHVVTFMKTQNRSFYTIYKNIKFSYIIDKLMRMLNMRAFSFSIQTKTDSFLRTQSSATLDKLMGIIN